MTAEQSSYQGLLNRVVTSEGTTSINVVDGSNEVVIGLAATATIDIGDINALGDAGYVTSGGGLMHETWEQYHIQDQKAKPWNAHVHASALEGKLIPGRETPGDTKVDCNRSQDIDGNISVPIKTFLDEKLGTVTVHSENNNVIRVSFRGSK